MFKANWPYLVNIALFIGYFIFRKDQTAWPDPIVVWAWLPYLAHLFIHNFVDGFQNTPRNIARIHLLETRGKDYDNAHVAPIQIALVPRSMVPVTLVWFAIHIISFAVLLFYQGWATALAAEFFLIGFGWIFPINYPGHLKRIRKHLNDSNRLAASQVPDADLENVAEIVNRAIKENRNPQEWWASFYEQP